MQYKFFAMISSAVMVSVGSINNAWSDDVFHSNDYCNGLDIIKIQRPIYPDKPTGGSFSYSFRQLREAKNGGPTVIFLPGGPGDDSMLGKNPHHNNNLDLLPDDFGLILTDPRGVGCNKTPSPLPNAAISTEILASDILAIIVNRKLERYYVHGLSYGTQLAIVVAALAERTSIKKPEAVILEGVLARAFRPLEMFQGFMNRWDAILANLDGDTRKMLRSREPLGIEEQTLGAALTGLLVNDQDDQGPGMSLRLIKKLSNSPKEEHDKLVKDLTEAANSINDPIPPEVALQYREIGCHEIASEPYNFNSDALLTFKNGRLTPVIGHACDGIKLDRPFDTANYKITSPIYYFQGVKDPTTLMSHARYSFSVETLAPRTLVSIEDGGHHSMWGLRDCEAEIWKQIEKGGRGLESALHLCELSSTVERAFPRQ
jgi:pimeloyl-ACP methyl ester carboxylesterase